MTQPTHDPTCRICAQSTGTASVVGGASAWAVFVLSQRASKGETTVDPAAVTRIMADFQAALKASPETGRW